MASIIEYVPGAEVLSNKIPKNYVNHELYCNLIYNEEQTMNHYEMIPRRDSFEISYKGYVSKVFE